MRFRAGVVCGALLLSGCASIVSKSEWPVRFHSNRGAVQFEILNESHEVVATGTTPQVLVLPASNGYFDGMDYRVRYAGRERFLTADVNFWTLGNLLIPYLGYVGILFVDPLTGCFYRLDEACYLFVPDDELVPALEPSAAE